MSNVVSKGNSGRNTAVVIGLINVGTVHLCTRLEAKRPEVSVSVLLPIKAPQNTL